MYDITIVGAGIPGLVSALLLAQKTSLRIAVLDAKSPELSWSEKDYDLRVYAVIPAVQAIFEELGIWSTMISKRAAPFKAMQVWDAQGRGELAFHHADLNVPTLGYILEENLIRSILFEKLKDYPQIELHYPVKLSSLTLEGKPILNFDSENNPLQTQLLIGADGANSWVRQQAKIALNTSSYDHSALIAQVTTTLPHQNTARQSFLSTGPLAFLPLADPHQCSIVWSIPPKQAEDLLALDDQGFQEELTKAFDSRLGKIRSVSQRHSFSLQERHAQHYVKSNLALIGDAAHTLHPLAGQGMNLGVLDAACLTTTISEALNKNRDYTSLSTLRRYERARKAHNQLMLVSVKFLKNLFCSKSKLLQELRNQGLNLTNRYPALKNFFANYAMGKAK